MIPGLTMRVHGAAEKPMSGTPSASAQGLTLLHFSAQRKRFLWDRGCIQGLFRGYVIGVKGYLGDV